MERMASKEYRAINRHDVPLFPFEEKFFRERGIETMFVGHPLQITKQYQLGDDARSSIIPKGPA